MGNTYIKRLVREYGIVLWPPFSRIYKLVLQFTFENIRVVLQPDFKAGISTPDVHRDVAPGSGPLSYRWKLARALRREDGRGTLDSSRKRAICWQACLADSSK